MKAEEKEQKEQHKNENYNFLQGRFIATPPPGEEIVISGLSGTFPNSTDVYHFQHNLFNKINMVLPNRRWDYSHPEVPKCSGTLPKCKNYDAGFFGVHALQAEAQDVMSRIVAERVIEALFDSGLSLSDVEGTNTGVYVGTCFSESEKSIFHDNMGPSPKYGFTGCTRSSMAHRVSYFLKLKGPSFIADTACSSSLFALENAFRDLRLGLVDMAIVAGANVCLHPFVSLQFARLGVLSLDGSCKVFDKSGNGYARSEAVGAIILQKSKFAKRKYCDVIYVKTNCDGFKEAGITYPSGEAQRQLLTEFYRDAGVDPASLSFLEAHGTGTFVGDPEECSGIDEVLAKCRKDPLLIGSVKSNIGHSEPASGICSITKCIIGMETGFIPPNIHFTNPRENIYGIIDGRMKVVTEKMPFADKRGLIGVNSFGFGGGNCHVLLRANQKEKLNNGLPDDDIPRVICISGRIKESITTLLDEVRNSGLDAEYIRLLHDIFRKNIPNHIYRGFSILSKSGEICRFNELYPGSKTPLYFVFGELSEWYNIGKDLMLLPVFVATLQKVQMLLLSKGINVMDTLFGKTNSKTKNQVLGSILVQMGLIDIFKALELQPTNYFGNSYGELLAAYFDGILTFKQTVECAFAMNDVIDKVDGLAKKHRDGKLANINKTDSTSSINFRATFNLPEFSTIKKELLTNLSNILDKPKIYNNGNSKEKFGSAEYFVNALTENCSSKFDYVESNSIVLSFGDILTPNNDNESIKIIQMGVSKDTNNLISFLKILGNLYVNGYESNLSKLYPEVQFPVGRGTRMVSPFIKWKHEREWFVPSYNLQATTSAQHSARKIKVQVSDQQWTFIQGHTIDGRNLFPATGYLYLIWETLSIMEEVPMTIKNVVFEDCKFLRATTLPKKGHLVFFITINRFSGHFEIIEGGSIVVSGKVFSRDDEEPVESVAHLIGGKLAMNSKDVYKELRLRGYNYSGGFRSIKECSEDASIAYIKWDDNWITFIDNMLQVKILQTDTRLLYVPTYIAQLILPAKHHLEIVNKRFLSKQKEPLLPVTCNKLSGEISCGNLVIRGLMASSIPRKKDLGIPVLESYQFIPNNTNLQLKESIRVNMQIFLENSLVRKVKVIEIIDDFTKEDSIVISLIQSAFEDQPLVTPLVKILTNRTIETTIPIEDKDLSSESDCNIIIGSELLKRPKLLKTAYGSLKDNSFIISRESLNFNENYAEIVDFTIFTIHKTQSESIVLLKKNSKTKELVSLNIGNTNDFPWVETLKDIIKMKKFDNVLLYSQNDLTSGLLGLVNCLRREPESSYVKGLLILDHAEDFDKEKPFYKNQLSKNMATNIWKDGTWGTYRHLPLKDLKTVKSEHCFVNPTLRGDLSSLRWIEGTLRTDMIVPPEKELVRVQYASLNFRDVMTASGKINADVITQDRLEQECVQGFEFSGLDQKGNKVMGMITHGALSSLVLADKYILFKAPDSLSLEQAATIPVVYGTIIYGMLIRGKLKKNESVLIHSGTGGIGQAAIRLALHNGSTVYTTVGTQEKKDYLLKMFPQLRESNIGNSHDLSFEKMVMKGTNGRGVDMVLNSLADQKLLASLRCLAHGGRFIEIGKFDLANNTQLNLILLRKEASFHGVMLDSLMSCTPDVKAEIANILNKNIGTFIVPLPATVFGYDQVEDAFRFMSTGKHMGKVLIKARNENQVSTKVEKFCGIPRYFCYPDKTYIIIGGLGGFGLELTDWLILRGARNVVLTSRNGITTGYQRMRVELWESYGVNIHISRDDICTEDGCRNMLKVAGELGDVQSIFNLAVVLADAVFENQTDETFKTSFGPKAIATAHLDRVSRLLCPTLRDFIVFSSVTCGRGNAGQTNYGMSNSVMERICEKRRSEGYPALAIQWGAIGDVGLVAELQEEHIELEIGGTLQQKISSCLNVLNTFLRQKDATILSSIVVAEKRGGLESCDNIVDTIINILGLNNAKTVSHHATLPELGMDSMTGVEIKQTLEREFEVFLTPKDMKTMTLAKLKEIQEQKCFSSEEKDDSGFLSMILEDIGDEEEIKLNEIHFKPQLENKGTSNILLFPGVEGFAKKFTKLASNLNAPSIGFQYWENPESQSVHEMAQKLLPRVESYVKQNEMFNIIAYSFGSLIAFEIVHMLESKGHIGNVIIIDGGVLLMKKLALVWMGDSERIFETELLCHLLSFHVPTEKISEYQEKLLKCNSWKERLEEAKEVLIKISPDQIEYHRTLGNGIYHRSKAIGNYTPSYDKLKSKITLFKPANGLIKDIEEDHGLSKISASKVEVQVFEGNHGNILANEKLAEAVNFINNLRIRE